MSAVDPIDPVPLGRVEPVRRPVRRDERDQEPRDEHHPREREREARRREQPPADGGHVDVRI